MFLCMSIDQGINHGRNFRKLLKQNGNNKTKLIEFAERTAQKSKLAYTA